MSAQSKVRKKDMEIDLVSSAALPFVQRHHTEYSREAVHVIIFLKY